MSGINRFNGATGVPYSVAQHSVIMSHMVDDDISLQALFHDAHEYIIGDIVTPTILALGTQVKNKMQELKTLMDYAIGVAFSIDMLYRKDDIKHADLRMLMTEASQLFISDRTSEWSIDVEKYDIEIIPWASDYAKFRFQQRFKELRQKGKQ